MAKTILTPKRIADFSCNTTEPSQAYLWDSEVSGLGVRAQHGGRKTFIFQKKLNGKVLRLTVADVGSITLADARTEGKRLSLLIAQGIDPREQKRQIIEEQEQARAAREREDAIEQIKGLPLRDAWEMYLFERKPRWGERHYIDHVNLSQAPGRPLKRGKGTVQAGPLYPLLNLKISKLTPATIEAWLAKETAKRPTQARLAFGALKAFINWLSEHDVYKTVLPDSLITRRIKEVLPKKAAKNDCLQKEQLAGWFQAVRQLPPVTAAYLQCLLLTGARREEMANLRWIDIDFKWKSMTIKDKVEGQRIIPLTLYVDHLLRHLPRRNEWVFSSPAAASGRLLEPRRAHKRALAVAGIGDDLSLHGLRRSFKSLSEWVELPVGVVAQIMGHKPSATAERHYTIRPVDLLRMWHSKLEEWILEQAGVPMPEEEAFPLRLLAGQDRKVG